MTNIVLSKRQRLLFVLVETRDFGTRMISFPMDIKNKKKLRSRLTSIRFME